MKIAFLNITQGLVNRGAETYAKELSKRLQKNHEVDLIVGSEVPLKRWPILWRFYLDPHGLTILLWTLSKIPILMQKRYDVIIPLNGGWQTLIVRILTLLYGSKMVVSGQSGKGWDDRINLWILPDAFIALSSRLKTWAKNVNPFVRSYYIPNGVDLDNFKPTGSKKDFGLASPIVLSVGALNNEKRLELVIKAVGKIDNASLLVVGEGPLKTKLEQMGQEILGSRFKLTHAKFEDLPEIYRSANVFTLPSPWYRSFEIVFTEAMATNLPVVANDDPIRREIVGDAGLFVDPTDVDEYADALRKAIDTKWGDKPRRQAEKFSWDKIAEQYEKLFKELRN